MNERVCKKPSAIKEEKHLTGVDLVQYKKKRNISANLCRIEQTLIEAMCYACFMRGYHNGACMMYGETSKTSIQPTRKQCNDLFNSKELELVVSFKGEGYTVKLTGVESRSSHEKTLLGTFSQIGCKGHDPRERPLAPHGQMLKVRYFITYEKTDLSYYPLSKELTYKGRLIDKGPAGITHSEIGSIVYNVEDLACELDYVKRSFSSITSVTFDGKEEYVYITDNNQKSLQVSLGREVNHQCLGVDMIELSMDELLLCKGCNLGIGELSLDLSAQFYDAFMQLNTVNGIRIRTQQHYLEETQFELCQLINFLNGKNYDLEPYLGSNGEISVKQQERFGMTYLTTCSKVLVMPLPKRKECFEQLPVLFKENEMFLESGTYHLKRSSQRTECNNKTVFQAVSGSGEVLYFCNLPELKLCNIPSAQLPTKNGNTVKTIQLGSLFNESDSKRETLETLQKARGNKLGPGQVLTTTNNPNVYSLKPNDNNYDYPNPYLFENMVSSYFNKAKSTVNFYANYLSFESRNYCAFVILVSVDHIMYILKIKKVNVVIILMYLVYLYLPVLYIVSKISHGRKGESRQVQPQNLVMRNLARVERVAASHGRIRAAPDGNSNEPCHPVGASGETTISESESGGQLRNPRGPQQSSQ